MEKSKELNERVSELEKQNDEVSLSIMAFHSVLLWWYSQLTRKVKILEGDLEQTEDTLDEKRQYDASLHVVNSVWILCIPIGE